MRLTLDLGLPPGKRVPPADIHPEAIFYIDYTTDIAWINGRPVAFDPLHTVVRANADSTAEFADGSVKHFGANVLRRTDRGARFGEERTNIALHGRDWTQAAYTPTNITPTKDATGRDGVANSASRLTATAGNGTILQAITAASAERVSTVDVQRLTGTGTVEFSDDGGSTWLDITADIASGDWYRAEIIKTQANPSLGIRLAVSGDEVIVDYLQCEAGAFSTSRIPTGAASATRNIDNVEFSDLSWLDATQGTFLAVTNGIPAAVGANSRILAGAGGAAAIMRVIDTQIQTFNGAVAIFSNLGSGNFSSDARGVVAWDGAGRSVVGNDGTVATDANAIGSLANLWLMSQTGTTQVSSGWLRQIQYIPSRLSDADAKAWSAL